MVTYAVPASYRDGSMLLTVPQAGRPGMPAVTLVQCAPASRVTCTSPSLVPAQTSPFSRGDLARLARALVEALDGPSEAAVSGAGCPDDVVVRRVGDRPAAFTTGDRMP